MRGFPPARATVSESPQGKKPGKCPDYNSRQMSDPFKKPCRTCESVNVPAPVLSIFIMTGPNPVCDATEWNNQCLARLMPGGVCHSSINPTCEHVREQGCPTKRLSNFLASRKYVHPSRTGGQSPRVGIRWLVAQHWFWTRTDHHALHNGMDGMDPFIPFPPQETVPPHSAQHQIPAGIVCAAPQCV